MTKLAEDQVRRIEELVRRVDQIPDPDARATAGELMESILALHGAGMERMMELVSESGPAGDAAIRRFANDSLVASLLVLHGLHPDDIETRVRQVLSKQSLHAELVGVFEGVVRVRVPPGGCHSNGNSAQSLETVLRDAVPDAAEIIVEEGLPQNGFVPLAAINSLSGGTVLTKG